MCGQYRSSARQVRRRLSISEGSFLQRIYQETKTDVSCIRGDSHDSETKAELESVLNGQDISVLYIDGDHTYQGVKQDFMDYVPLVKSGGIVVLNDLCTHQRDNPSIDTNAHGVGDFWEAVVEDDRYATEEIMSQDNETRPKGLGIAKVPR